MAIRADESPDDWVRSVMSDSRSPADWLRLLTSADADDRHRANYKLGSLTPADRQFYPELVTALRSTDDRLRFIALGGLKRLGHFPHDLLPAIRKALIDPVQAVRQTALLIASRFDPLDDEIVSRVCGILKSDPEQSVRCDAARTAGEMPATGASIIPDLVAATRDGDASVRRRAVIAIKLLGPIAGAAAARMWELSEDNSDPATRLQATAALRAMGAQLG